MNKLPNNTGVYTFLDNKKGILYIGKATNLKSRVGSYFQGRDERGMRIALMVAQVADIKIQETDSVLEALILESNLIKKFQPKYNVERKDDKSFSYVTISKEIYPRVEIVRETNITSPFGKGELGGFEKLSTRKNPSPTLPLKKGDKKIRQEFKSKAPRAMMQVAIDIPIVVGSDRKGDAKSQGSNNHRNSKCEPDKIVLEQKMPPGFRLNFFILYLVEYPVAKLFHTFFAKNEPRLQGQGGALAYYQNFMPFSLVIFANCFLARLMRVATVPRGFSKMSEISL